MRPVLALWVAAGVLVALAASNLVFYAIDGGPFASLLSASATFLVLAGVASAIALGWSALGTPVTIRPFWRTTFRIVAVLLFLLGGTQLPFVLFLGGRVLGSVLLVWGIAALLVAVSFVGRRHSVDVSLLPDPAPGPPFLPPPPPLRVGEPLPYLPPPPDPAPAPSAREFAALDAVRGATLQTVSAAYAQARARILFALKIATAVAAAPIVIVGAALIAFGPLAGLLLLVWAFSALVWGIIGVGWYASLLLIDDDLSLGQVPGPEHPRPPALAIVDWVWRRRVDRWPPAPPAFVWDVGLAVAMIRFGRRMTQQARGAARAILAMVVFLAGPGGYLLTFAALLRYAGGPAQALRFAGAAWGVMILIWVAGFALLYRYYRETDRLDATFAELERGLLAIERDFWNRY